MSAPMCLPSRGRVARGGVLKFGSERACAPPALSALNLGRLQRVVLPVKRDCSVDNPNTPGDYNRPQGQTRIGLGFGLTKRQLIT